MASAAQPTCFLIADISGYAGYLADVELDHAQDILADLIGAVVTALWANFRLAKLEGDTAFTFMTAEKLDGSMLLDTIERCYVGFRRRRRDVRQATSCECNACAVFRTSTCCGSISPRHDIGDKAGPRARKRILLVARVKAPVSGVGEEPIRSLLACADDAVPPGGRHWCGGTSAHGIILDAAAS